MEQELLPGRSGEPYFVLGGVGGIQTETPREDNDGRSALQKNLCPDGAPRTPERAKPGSRLNPKGSESKTSVCDPEYSTPSAKRGGLFTKPVRRRLSFNSESMDDSSSDSFSGGGGDGEKCPKKGDGSSSKITVLSSSGEGGKGGKEEDKPPPRKIAQLVVWTNKAGGKEVPKEPLVKEEKKEKEEDLFVVQYPARPFTDQGKGRGKPFRRLNSYNDPIVVKKTPPPAPPQRRRGGEKRKRSAKPPNLKRNKENGGLPLGYLPNQAVLVDETTAAAVAAYQAYLQQFQQFQHNNLFAATQVCGDLIPQEPVSDAVPSLVKLDDTGMEVAGPSGASFSLPEQFTVTETQNEFDLLIQNVVHEEMVNDMGEEEFTDESARKRIRLEEMRSCEDTGPDEPGKPRCTYTELIEKALSESGGLTVSEIYNWISEHYPYFKQDDDRWKNSVRHNLSINPYFKKGEKARSGAGHLWTISEESKGLRPSLVSWDERRKSPCEPGELQMPLNSDTDRAVANILGIYRSKMAQEKASKNEEPEQQPESQLPTAQDCCQPPSVPLLSQVAPNTVNLSEINTGQFTVDLTGLNIPEGGAINFDELISNGRLIYIETASDSEANKENHGHHGTVTNPENMLNEVPISHHALEENRYAPQSYYQEPSLGLEGFTSKSAEGSYESGALLTMVPPSDIVAPTTTSDFTLLDQCLHPLDSYESSSSCVTTTTSSLAAALFESKELGIPYTFQIPTTSENLPSDLL